MAQESFMTAPGSVAGALTTILLLPQLVESWKSWSTQDMSIGMFLLIAVGITLRIVCGAVTSDLPVVASSVTLVFVGLILVPKLRCR